MSIGKFPSQKKDKRTDSFYKDCAKAALEIIDYDEDSGLRASMHEKRINYDLAANILDPSDVEDIVNPWKLTNANFPVNIRNYPLLKPKLDLLRGEEIKRRFDWKVMLKNSEAISEKEEQQKKEFFGYIKSLVLSPDEPNEEEVKRKMTKMDEMSKYSMQDMREKMSSQVLTYQWYNNKLKYKFNEGFDDVLKAAEEIYTINAISGDIVVRRENPLNVYTIGLGDSNYHEDAQIIVIDGYRPLGLVLDDYYEELSAKPGLIRQLEERSGLASNPEQALSARLTIPENYYDEAYGESVYIANSSRLLDAFAGGYDRDGNIRETRVLWKSMRKIGTKSYFDEFGVQQKEYVSGEYTPDEEAGEEIKWEWVTEWLKTTILKGDVFIGMGPIPRISMSMSNPSKCMSPVVGTIYNANNSTAMSLMSFGKPYQYLYNAIMYNNEKAIIKNRGVVPRLPLHLIPDGWEIEDWIYYFNEMGFAAEDYFKEGNKGAAMGKLAGHFTGSGQPIDTTNAQYIQQNLQMLQIIKGHIDDITGISPQRQGQIEQRELVRNVEVARTQSAHITEMWFYMHDNTKLRVLENTLEFTRHVWRDQKFKRQFVLDDGSSALLDFDYEIFATGLYGIFISDASSDLEITQSLKQLVGMAIQSGKARLSDAMAIYMSGSVMSKRRKLESSEEKSDQMAQQANQEKNQLMEALQKMKNEAAQEKNMTTEKVALLNSRVKLLESQLRDKSAYEADMVDLKDEELELKKQQHADDVRLREKELNLDDKHATKDEELQKKALSKKPVNATR